MTLVFDTSVLVALLHSKDPAHDRAKAIVRRGFEGAHGALLSPPDVLGEGLAFLRRRPARKEISTRYAALFTGDEAFLQMGTTPPDRVERAVRLHFEFYERGLSFVDCVLVDLCREWDAPIASFDSHFDGIVQRISS
ncbi:MAG: type II toxin-antitoxin system VapC family toxin [Thermoplasmatota archaeon]